MAAPDIAIMFNWALRCKPWLTLPEVNPVDLVDLVDLDRLIPPGYTGYPTRALTLDEVRDLRQRFTTVRAAWEMPGRPKRAVPRHSRAGTNWPSG